MTALRALSDDLSTLVARVSAGVVGLAQEGRGQGSGIVFTPDGYVLTNAHVVQPGKVRVRLGGDTAAGTVVGRDPRTDLAVVRVDASPLAPLTLAALSPRVGELVVAIGNPLGFDRSVSLGVVSALDRELPARGSVLEGLVQTDAAVNPGNSGGPLLDMDGNVVGVNTAMVPFARGLGFAVSARTASWVASVLLRDGQVVRPRLGIAGHAEDLGVAARATTGQARGIRVMRVDAGGAAHKGGLRSEDLLLSTDGRTLSSVDDLQAVMVLGGGTEIELLVWREGEARRLRLTPVRPAAHAA
jgi:S1-C subfamily serine protease